MTTIAHLFCTSPVMQLTETCVVILRRCDCQAMLSLTTITQIYLLTYSQGTQLRQYAWNTAVFDTEMPLSAAWPTLAIPCGGAAVPLSCVFLQWTITINVLGSLSFFVWRSCWLRVSGSIAANCDAPIISGLTRRRN